jgi:nitrite reductase/ring-hydroxylating ferredoxin subunit
MGESNSTQYPEDLPSKDGGPLWQQDFPINRMEELNNSRRQFLKFLGLTSLAFFTGTLGVAIKAALEQQEAKSLPQMRVIGVADVPEGKSFLFTYPAGERPGILIHTAGGNFVAYEQRCTHLLCPVLYEHEKNRLFCPCHEGAFNVETGERVAGPPPRPLNKIKLEIRGSDIYAVGMEGG